jgi:ketosteroid isomerase-like protein
MTIAANRKLFETIFAELSKGNGAPFLAAMADDFCWSIIGTTSWSRAFRGKRAVEQELLRPLLAQFKDRYTNTAERILADGDHVVIQCRGRVTTVRGLPYNNTYCWVIRMADGKMRDMTEYCDTALIETALAPLV